MKTNTSTIAAPAAVSLIRSIVRRLRGLNKAFQMLIGGREPAIVQAEPQTPAPRLRRRPKKPSRYLSTNEKTDIGLMLKQTHIPVAVIAKMFGCTRATIYNVRNQLGLQERRGNQAMMEGIRRHQQAA